VHGRHARIVDDGNAYLAAGMAGMGVLWLPRYMARAPLALGGLLPLLEDWQLDPMPLYVAFPPGRHVSRKLRVFIDWIVELLEQQAPWIVAPSPPIAVRTTTAPHADGPGIAAVDQRGPRGVPRR